MPSPSKISKINESLDGIGAGLSKVHQILITAGLISGILVAFWCTVVRTIIENNVERSTHMLLQNIEQLGILTDDRFDSLMTIQAAVQEDLFQDLFELSESQSNKTSAVANTVSQNSQSLKSIEAKISFIKSQLLTTQISLGGNMKENAELIISRAYTDSLQNELTLAILQQRSMQTLHEIRQNQAEVLKAYSNKVANLYPSSTKFSPHGVKIMTNQKKTYRRSKLNRDD